MKLDLRIVTAEVAGLSPVVPAHISHRTGIYIEWVIPPMLASMVMTWIAPAELETLSPQPKIAFEREWPPLTTARSRVRRAAAGPPKTSEGAVRCGYVLRVIVLPLEQL
jgi:hypothetical protein